RCLACLVSSTSTLSLAFKGWPFEVHPFLPLSSCFPNIPADRWLDLGRSCAIQQRAPCQSGAGLESLWDAMPEPGSRHWAKEPGSATAITSLIRDLSLGSSTPTAPPSKRHGFRSSWRPQGSRVWTTVEKRRCHSGGSVRGVGGFSGGHFPTMQRSSSFSLPSLPELQREEASEASSPDSTPELGRRAGQRAGGTGCLSRSRSQPCVLNDKKIGMKRRRQEDAQEQRPSLDLAKMTQKLQTFQSLSCPGFSATDGCQSTLPLPSFETSGQPDSEFTAVSELVLESRQKVARDDEEEEEDSSYEELDSDSACSMDSRPASPDGIVGGNRTLWKGDCGTKRDIFQLGGELDLDQIERN
uniref:Family with sequence similarity 53 member B n=1 Tax=Lates calcarifer TaxID=8187 RepID=A0A4W6DLG4_LATCA